MAHIDEPFARHDGARETWGFVRERVLCSGVVDQRVKALALRYVDDPDSVDVDAYAGRERAALDWAHAIVWDADRADDELWERLHELFTEEELVDLGCVVGFALALSNLVQPL